MSVLDDNIEITRAAQRKVRAIAEAAAPAEARFTIHFEGFGSGWTAKVTAEQAERYLSDLSSPDDAHARYRTRIRVLTISATIPETAITA